MMSKVYLNRKVLAGIIIMLSILMWMGVSSYYNSKELTESGRWVAHTNEVLYHSQKLLSVACDIELGQRGYSLTGNARFLEAYRSGRADIHSHFQKLKQLTRDNLAQQRKLVSLESSIDNLLIFSTNAVEASSRDLVAGRSLNATLRGKTTIDTIRQVIHVIQTEENALLKKRSAETEYQVAKFNTWLISLLSVTSLFLISIMIVLNGSLGRRVRGEQELRRASEEIRDLYENAPCGYHSIDAQRYIININDTLLTWLGYSKEAVIGKLKFEDIISDEDRVQFLANYDTFKENGFVNDVELNFLRKDGSLLPAVLNSKAIYDGNGRFVKSRSSSFDNTVRKEAETKIRKLNHELEAFTYSVSHDLRAPLRSIDGYARVLQEDYEPKLDEEGKRVLTVIVRNARRMGQLIDDLLEFARLGRKEVAKATMDMTPLVNGIAFEFVRESGRKIDITVNPLIPAIVDVDMIKQVWLNLMSNAVKYSSKQEVPSIEISSFEQSDEVVYKIKDNGVGFDMQYAGKLFGVFQRLHKIQEFEGTGVGLAIVKRIVERHNGRVWAEGELNQGASFYFTIPHTNGKL